MIQRYRILANGKVIPSDSGGYCAYADCASLTQQVAALRKLAAFGAGVLMEHRGNSPWEIGDVDGGWCQDEAIRLGLLEAREVTEACGTECACVGDFPTTCYFLSDAAKAALQLTSDGENV
jgi:hypothetical protein